MYDNSDTVLMVSIALLNFSFELKTAKRCCTQSFEIHADHIRQRQFPNSTLDALGSAAGIVLRDLQTGSPHMESVLTLHWGCVMSLSCGGKRSPFVPKVRYRTALPGELLCVALGIHEGKWSHGAFPLKRHRLNLLNL